MKKTHELMISELMSQLNEDEKDTCRRIVDSLTELGYIPQRQKVQCFVLSFKNREVNQTIAKIGVRSGVNKGVFYSIKFYACKNPPEKFQNAVRDAILKSNKQYVCSDCGVCGAEKQERGYHYTYPNGEEFIRCGAYVVEIPDLASEDIDDFNNLLREQHTYFATR